MSLKTIDQYCLIWDSPKLGAIEYLEEAVGILEHALGELREMARTKKVECSEAAENHLMLSTRDKETARRFGFTPFDAEGDIIGPDALRALGHEVWATRSLRDSRLD